MGDACVLTRMLHVHRMLGPPAWLSLISVSPHWLPALCALFNINSSPRATNGLNACVFVCLVQPVMCKGFCSLCLCWPFTLLKHVIMLESTFSFLQNVKFSETFLPTRVISFNLLYTSNSMYNYIKDIVLQTIMSWNWITLKVATIGP